MLASAVCRVFGGDPADHNTICHLEGTVQPTNGTAEARLVITVAP